MEAGESLIPKPTKEICDKKNCIDQIKEKSQQSQENISVVKGFSMDIRNKPSVSSISEWEINFTSLIKSLVFSKFPDSKKFMNQRDHIDKMYKILSKKKVPYSQYP